MLPSRIRRPRLPSRKNRHANAPNPAPSTPAPSNPQVEFHNKLLRALDERTDTSRHTKKTHAGCLVATENERSSACKCIYELCSSHRTLLTKALTLFLQELLNQKPDQRQSHAAKFALSKGPIENALNASVGKGYALPITTDGSVRKVIVCRNSMMTLTRRCLGLSWKEINCIFPFVGHKPTGAGFRKQAVMDILRYLLEHDYRSHTNVDWKHPDFLSLGLNLHTSKKHVRVFQLREAASIEIFSAVHHKSRLQDRFGAQLIDCSPHLSGSTQSDLRVRGSDANGYRPSQLFTQSTHCLATRSSAIDRTTGDRTTPSVRRRIISISEHPSDKASVAAVEKLMTPIAAAMSRHPSELSFIPSFALCAHHDPQPPSIDQSFCPTDPSKTFTTARLAICPLTHTGCYQQLWESDSQQQQGVVVFIPRGSILLLAPGCVRGGGLLSSPQSNDLTLEILVTAPQMNGMQHRQLLLSEKQYPLANSLTPGGRLERAFNSDQPR